MAALESLRITHTTKHRSPVRRQQYSKAVKRGATTFYSVEDSGLRCLVAPCFNLDLVVLNLGTSDAVSGLDLRGAGATAADVTAGHSAAATGDLRVFGTISTDTTPGPGGAFGRTLDARQFFLPVR